MGTAQSDCTNPQILHIRTQHSDEMSDLVPDWQQEYIQVQKGTFSWENMILQIGDFQFIEEFFGGPTIARGQTEKDTVALAIPQTLIGSNIYCGHELTFQTLLTADRHSCYDLTIGEQLKHFIVVAPINQVMVCAEKLQRPIDTLRQPSVEIIFFDPSVYNDLDRYLKNLFFLVKNYPEQLAFPLLETSMAQLILDDVLPLLVDILTIQTTQRINNQSKKGESYRQLVNGSNRFIKDNIDRPITLQDLCDHLSTSQRSLNYAFKSTYGIPPMEYLKVVRLNQVRRALRRADPSVDQVRSIAVRFGFWHLSRFSADYQKAFGETPSETLRLP